MGRELYERDPGFRAVMRHADQVVHAHCGESVLATVFAEDKGRHIALDRLLYSHLAIFMVEYALAKTLIDRGVQADMVLGASLGAFAAATVAGCMDPDIALSAVLEQAITLEACCQAGCMMAVMGERDRFLSPELLALCEHGASNFASHSVIALPESNRAAVEVYLRGRDVAFQQLPVRFAFHSRWIDEAGARYRSFLQNLPMREPALSFVCCTTGETLKTLPPNYFWSVVREPILLQQTIQSLELQDSYRYIDLSPSGSMATLLKYALAVDSKSDVRSIMSVFGSDADRLDQLVSDHQRTARSSSAKFAPLTPRHPGLSAQDHHAVELRHMKACIFPGQGSQFKGMGDAVFPLFPELVKQASDILGYSLEDLCINDRQGLLSKTQYTQPALYVVNALHYLKEWGPKSATRPDYLAGHSLGEYNALFAAGAFSFETGLRLVKKRGELMGASTAGGMAAVLGVASADIRAILDEHGLTHIDIANFNTPTQTVIAGDKEALAQAAELFAKRNLRCVVLNVSAAFHSRHMQGAQAEFAEFLRSFSFNAPQISVIANTTARPYKLDRIAETLAAQIATPVRWVDSIRYLMGCGEMVFQEIGASVLSKMVLEIKATETPIIDSATSVNHASEDKTAVTSSRDEAKADVTEVMRNSELSIPLRVSATSLGSELFRRRYGLQYAYMAGAMYRGVASADLVIKMGKAGFLSFFGAGGLSREKIETNIVRIQSELNAGQPYGMNLLANYEYPSQEEAVVELYLKYGVKNVEAAAFMQMTPALVRYRLQGLRLNERGDVVCTHRVVAKVSRPEVAKAFMSPPPAHIVDHLLERGLVTPQQAEWSKRVPVSHDICVEADSGGHTDGGIAAVMLPPLLRMRDEIQHTYSYAEPVCMGLAGGIGGPEAAAAAFLLGADFVTTGSINQCTVEAGMSDDGKSMLQQIDIHDTEYAPAGDMFEIGSQVQVMKKSVFFPARANKLLSLYRHYESLDDIPSRTRNQLEGTFFKKTFDEIWNETANHFRSIKLDHEIAKAEANAKHKMALVFRWYFAYSTRLAIEGKGEDRVNYQIHTGPALGSFNQWVKGTELESWTKRHVDHIAFKLMDATAEHLMRSFGRFASH
jgi:trans-AT polyketide synthase/acyltransferase/oxidoreductase domain-containing protein